VELSNELCSCIITDAVCVVVATRVERKEGRRERERKRESDEVSNNCYTIYVYTEVMSGCSYIHFVFRVTAMVFLLPGESTSISYSNNIYE
jgi:hypothetical protein